MPRKHHGPQHVETPSPYVERPPIDILGEFQAAEQAAIRRAAAARLQGLADQWEQRKRQMIAGPTTPAVPINLPANTGGLQGHFGLQAPVQRRLGL